MNPRLCNILTSFLRLKEILLCYEENEISGKEISK